MEHLKNRHHALFILVVAALILFVLTSPLIGTQAASQQGGQQSDQITGQAVVCCTFSYNGLTKTCAVTATQTCDTCDAVCNAKK